MSAIRTSVALAVAALLILVCGTLALVTPLPGPDAAVTPRSSPDLRVLAGIRHEHLTLYPVVRAGGPGPRDTVDYVTLDEGLASGEVTVRETGNVNRLEIDNRGRRTVFVLAGEMVTGGKQDRIVGANQTIAAGQTRSVPAFCVEHGRWDATRRFDSKRTMVHANLRRIARSGKGQQAVWDEVSSTNGKLGTRNATQSYRHNFSSRRARALQEAYLAALAPKLADHEHLVGLVVAINGQLQTADLFRSAALFARLRDKLLRAYVIDAITQADGRPDAAPDASAATAFIDRIQQMQETARNGRNRTLRSSGFVAFSSVGEDGQADHVTCDLDR